MVKRDDELAVLLKRLAHRHRVYVRSGLLPATTGGVSGVLAAVAAELNILLRQLHRRDWQDSAGPASVQEVEEAEAVAGQVVQLLGADARWWSNRDGSSWTDVSGCTFDSLVAGTDGRRFAVLIQVGED
ncbi:hypothetical protein [Streptomyces sp. NPDC001401]|uniref:hypothetical protein n=1 Tax=Streptomyces sp. NPDC001401 TaxID=3364570 RepID=UPI0036BF106F